MNKVYTIFESATGFPVDVVAHLTCAIGMIGKWEECNPGIEFDHRPATRLEQLNAHIIQNDAAIDFVQPQ